MTRNPHIILFSILFVFTVLQGTFAQSYETVDMHLAIELKRIGTGPEKVNQRLLFSYSSGKPVRLVGIAFLHENFQRIHPFSRNRNGVYVLPYSPPEGTPELVYRFVVDGIWMPDPNNTDTVLLQGGVHASRYPLPRTARTSGPVVTTAADGHVTFRYPSDLPASVSVVGNFNHWDPFMHNLKQDAGRRDLYSLSLMLPRGTYYYYFVVNGQRVTDPANPVSVRKNDGTLVSVLEVQS